MEATTNTKTARRMAKIQSKNEFGALPKGSMVTTSLWDKDS
jgi:hypothetical protein